MKMTAVKEKAKEVGVKPGKKKKRELIHEIQVHEGNTSCYQSEIAPVCGLAECLWREDCMPAN